MSSVSHTSINTGSAAQPPQGIQAPAAELREIVKDAYIYGNSKEEANYPIYFVDSERQPLNGATGRYTVRFEAGRLPPVNAFWSLTMYQLPASLLTENPIDRYLINSQMEPNLVRDADGGITLYPARVAWQGQGSELAARTEGAVLHGAARILAEARGAGWLVESAATRARHSVTLSRHA